MKKKGLLNYIGVDIGKLNCVVCIMDSNGSIIKETNYNNYTLEQAESFASCIKTRFNGGESTAVSESTGNLWLKTSQAFEKHSRYALSAMLSFRHSLSFILAMTDVMASRSTLSLQYTFGSDLNVVLNFFFPLLLAFLLLILSAKSILLCFEGIPNSTETPSPKKKPILSASIGPSLDDTPSKTPL